MNKSEENQYTSVDLDSHKIEKGSQPVFIDLNSDTFIDFIYNQNNNSGDHDIRAAIYDPKNNGFESNSIGFLDNYIYVNENVGCKSIPNEASLKLSVPNFSTLTDMNSDCVSDLYLVAGTSTSDINGYTFISTKVTKGGDQTLRYCLVEIEDLYANNYTSPVFADFNNDGTIDKVLYNTGSNAIHTFYNERPANSAGSSTLCRDVPEVVNNGPAGLFTDYTLYTGSPDVTVLSDTSGLYAHPLLESFIPGQLRTGDIDSDGFPDLFSTFTDMDGNPVTLVLINSECGADNISHNIKRSLEEDNAECTTRTFDTTNDFDEIAQIEDSMYGFFIDFDDNGRIDFVIVKLGSSSTTTLQTFYNNFSRDSYYITATTYTAGAESFGSKVYGVSYRGIYTSLGDSRIAFVAQQISRVSFGALEQPIATYVIGRSNNYIEDFTVTYPIQESSKLSNVII